MGTAIIISIFWGTNVMLLPKLKIYLKAKVNFLFVDFSVSLRKEGNHNYVSMIIFSKM